MAAEKKSRICRTPEECFEAGYQNATDRGWKLSPTQAARMAALLRPHLRRVDAA